MSLMEYIYNINKYINLSFIPQEDLKDEEERRLKREEIAGAAQRADLGSRVDDTVNAEVSDIMNKVHLYIYTFIYVYTYLYLYNIS